MRFQCLLVICIGLVAAAAARAAEPVILVTAFQPFAGRGVNGSATVAQRLAGEIIAGGRVTVLVMPVRWGEPARQLPAAVARLQPRLLLGLGEGYAGLVTVERMGANLARPIPDEGQALPTAAQLEPAGPATRPARLDFAPEWFSAAALPVRASADAGGYLCNELLYRALGEPVQRCGFMHLPPQAAVSDDAYAAALVPLVRIIIERNLAP